MKRFLILTITLLLSLCLITPAWACGMLYVPVIQQADTRLYNKASQVILARYDNKTVLTLSTDYQGDVKDFAMIVPVPVVLTADQVKIGDPSIFDKLNASTAPQLRQHLEETPCSSHRPKRRESSNVLGVTIEEQFTLGVYDILILSAQESDGLETWLQNNNYAIPQDASRVLRSYIRQQMKFFVAKVNLAEFNKTGYKFLSPLVMTYDSPKFMLPIRLGMINAKDEQDLIIYLLSSKGRVEVSNYRTVEVTSRVNVPEFITKEFSEFYDTIFTKDYERENKNVVFLEFSGDSDIMKFNSINYNTNSNQKLTDKDLEKALTDKDLEKAGISPLNYVFLTRLHVRYTRDKFPEDLQFQETENLDPFFLRYEIIHPYRGKTYCFDDLLYARSTRTRQEKEAQTLAKITGWDISEIRAKINFISTNKALTTILILTLFSIGLFFVWLFLPCYIALPMTYVVFLLLAPYIQDGIFNFVIITFLALFFRQNMLSAKKTNSL